MSVGKANNLSVGMRVGRFVWSQDPDYALLGQVSYGSACQQTEDIVAELPHLSGLTTARPNVDKKSRPAASTRGE